MKLSETRKLWYQKEARAAFVDWSVSPALAEVEFSHS